MAEETEMVPHWKQDFPFERSAATSVSRRDFARYLCFVSAGLAAGTGLVALKTTFLPLGEVKGEHLVCKTSEVPIGGTHAFVLEGSTIPYIQHVDLGADLRVDPQYQHSDPAALRRAKQCAG